MLKKILTSKIFLILILVALSLITYHLLRITKHKYELKSKLEPLNKEIEQTKQKKEELSENFAYFKTESYAEKEAREKLNLKKEGEEVIIVSKVEKKPEQKNLNTKVQQLTAPQKEDQTTTTKTAQNYNNNSKIVIWWNYFFGS